MRDFAKFVVLYMLRAYKWAISPLFPPACRYVPTCSEYAMEAIERCGALRGGFMALVRLLRCHPFTRGGYDPVLKSRDVASRSSDDGNTWNGPLRPRNTVEFNTAKSKTTKFLLGFGPWARFSQHWKRNA
jgi:uncharacterized protein